MVRVWWMKLAPRARRHGTQCSMCSFSFCSFPLLFTCWARRRGPGLLAPCWIRHWAWLAKGHKGHQQALIIYDIIPTALWSHLSNQRSVVNAGSHWQSCPSVGRMFGLYHHPTLWRVHFYTPMSIYVHKLPMLKQWTQEHKCIWHENCLVYTTNKG